MKRIQLKHLINEEIMNNGTTPKHSSDFLYHSTNIKNYESIRNYGLLPDFGETLKTTYSPYYDFNGSGEDDELAQLDFDGILFFSDKPLIGFSQFRQNKFKWEEALLCVVLNNDTIFKKISDYPKFIDNDGNEVHDVDYVSTHNLPIFIETGDYFSFEEQECEYLLFGDNLKEYVRINFPEIFKRYGIN